MSKLSDLKDLVITVTTPCGQTLTRNHLAVFEGERYLGLSEEDMLQQALLEDHVVACDACLRKIGVLTP